MVEQERLNGVRDCTDYFLRLEEMKAVYRALVASEGIPKDLVEVCEKAIITRYDSGIQFERDHGMTGRVGHVKNKFYAHMKELGLGNE